MVNGQRVNLNMVYWNKNLVISRRLMIGSMFKIGVVVKRKHGEIPTIRKIV